jgi:hypothetical protein
MSDDEADADGEELDEAETTLSTDTLDARLDDAAEALEGAETESDLDEVEEQLDTIESDIEAADLPEADDDEEDDPETELSDRLSDLRDDLEEQRGPYAEDVVAALEDAQGTIEDTRWTDDGLDDVAAAVRTFAEESPAGEFGVAEEAEEAVLATLDDAIAAVEDAGLDPDEDGETIAALVEASDDLAAALDEAEEWEDLSVREMLDFHGFYEVLDHRKDFPPEWHALKLFERDGDAEKILVALDLLDSDFMERHCLEALERMGPEAEPATEEMLGRAERREKRAIRILGKIGAEDAVDTLVEFVDADSDPQLQKATFRALGEIGAEEAVQPLANQLVADSEDTRSRAARALGLIGDARAVDPLADVLADDDSDTVRASAAWALRQIGTEAALDEVVDYADDRAYLVQAEAEKAV